MNDTWSNSTLSDIKTEIEGDADVFAPSKLQKQNVLFVLGMHRSGTSTCTGILEKLGVNLGNNLMAAHPTNPKGFWEHEDILDIHERLLQTLHSYWADILPLPNKWWLNSEVQPFKDELIEIVQRDFANAPFWGVKDPRLCRLLPLWKDLLLNQECRPCFVHLIRNPLEIVVSMQKRNGVSFYQGIMAWLRHMLEAEMATRGLPRIFVSYSQILKDWKTVYERIALELEIVWPQKPADVTEQISQFLSPQLRHHAGSDKEFTERVDIPAFAIYAYEELLKATEDTSYDLSAGMSSCRIQLEESARNSFPVLAMLEEMRVNHREEIQYILQEAHKYTKLQEKDSQIKQKESELFDKGVQLRDKDIQLQSKEAQLLEKNSLLQSRDSQLREKEALLRTIQQSISWRITRPLRFIHSGLFNGGVMHKGLFWGKKWTARCRRALSPRSMRVAMVTLCLGDDYAQTMAAGIRSKEEYCRCHGYDFFVGGEEVYDAQRPHSWSKIAMIKKQLRNYDYIFFSDADVVIVNGKITLEKLIHGHMKDADFMLTRDLIGNMNMGNFFVKNTPWSSGFLDRIYAQTDFIDHPWWENKAFIHLYETDETVRQHTQVITESNLFNSYLDPKNPYNEECFPVNDFLVHLAGFAWEGHSMEDIANIMKFCYDRRSDNLVTARKYNL